MHGSLFCLLAIRLHSLQAGIRINEQFQKIFIQNVPSPTGGWQKQNSMGEGVAFKEKYGANLELPEGWGVQSKPMGLRGEGVVDIFLNHTIWFVSHLE